ncbi:uncharacterized protein N7515_000286, partial [Penicillium bovifimosum]
WTISDLKDFMISTLPPELASHIASAAPIIHRCLLRLGSFPYQNDPHRTLSLEVLRTGIIILLRLEGNKLLDPDNNEASLVYPERLSAEQRILLFQSLTESPGPSAGSARSPGDDYHIRKALEIVTYGNFKRNGLFPTAVRKGPQYPLPEHFPSSNPTLASGSIQADEFRLLLRLMLLTQLYAAGLDPEVLTCSLAEIETATDCLLAAFLRKSSTVSFTAFDEVIGNSIQNLFLGLRRVLGPLHSPKPIPSPPSSVTEAQNKLKELFTPSIKTQPPPKGRIMNIPLLSQLSMSLPQDFPIEAPEILHSSQKVDIKGLKSCLSTTGLVRILLVSGKTSQGDAIFGAYFPKDSSPASMDMSVVFQLAPVHRMFRQDERLLPSPDDGEDGLRLTLALAGVSLVLSCESSRTLTAKWEEDTSQEVLVDAVEVLGFQGCMANVTTFE